MREFSLKILSYNIFGALYLPSTRKRIAKIGELLVKMAEEQDIHVICLQETFFATWCEMHLIQPWLRKFFAHASGAKKGFYLLDSGLTTLSQLKISKTSFHGFSRAEGVDGLANKGILLTRVQWPDGTELDIYNTHTQASYLSQNLRSVVRIFQVKEILEFIRKNSAEENNILLLGDLNVTEDHEEYNILLQEGGFTDVMRHIYPDRNSHPMTTIKKSHPSKEKKIDHVFLKLGKDWHWGFQKSDVKVLDLELSDHRSVFAEIVLQRA